MRQLNFDLKTLQARHREGAFLTRRDRSYVLNQAAYTLHALGFRRLRATGLKRKHVDALVAEWQRRGLAAGTMKNRMSALRWWAEHIGRPGVVGTNAAHGIGERRYVTNEDRSRGLDPEKLARVKDPHVAMSLRLQAAFGLRREEAIKFTPAYADRGDRVRIMASWAKGGPAREIPLWNEGQRSVLDAALTDWKAPAAGGPWRRSLPPAKRRIDSPAGQGLRTPAPESRREGDREVAAEMKSPGRASGPEVEQARATRGIERGLAL